ncbi:MAG: putative Bacterial extracellular solute-binding protein, family protein [Chloroflexi bacterium]|nr:putative Bacterial extracellular solute-binding protein, family protein [Chloroflexota bacterium]
MSVRWQRAIVGCLIVLVGCASPQVASPGSRVAEAPAEPGTPKTVTIGQLSTVKYYGPWDFGNPGGGGASLTEIHSAGLVTEDAQGRIIPRLATKLPSVDEGTLTVLPDGRMRATWQIRPDVLWHDGVALQAEDLAFSWQVHTHPDLPSGTGQDLRWIESAEATDATTLVLTWRSTYYRAMSLGHRELWPLPKRILSDAFASFPGRASSASTAFSWGARSSPASFCGPSPIQTPYTPTSSRALWTSSANARSPRSCSCSFATDGNKQARGASSSGKTTGASSLSNSILSGRGQSSSVVTYGSDAVSRGVLIPSPSGRCSILGSPTPRETRSCSKAIPGRPR